MIRYKNTSRQSGVAAYEIGEDYIAIEFNSGDTYLYTYAIPGRTDVEQMKALAIEGRGLSTYISRHIKHHYQEKLP